MSFSQLLINWYHNHHRSLPWRETKDPYRIWLSEIILQQTRVNQGLPYYNKFVEQFPNVAALANASQEEVLKLWQGLGYYSRARNLHTAAQQVVDLGGIFPNNYKNLLQLKGVGDYTAAAIASFAYGEAVPVLDGNVYRVLSRVQGIDTPINTPKGAKTFKAIAADFLDPEQPDTYNQAIMEFGALQCVPKNPQCELCPFHSFCAAYLEGRVAQLPVKLKKTKVKNLFHHYIVVQTPQGKTIVQQREQKGIWAGLYEFPFVDAPGPLLAEELIHHPDFLEHLEGVRFRESIYNQEPIVHKLTHRKVHAYFWIIETEEELDGTISIAKAFSKPLHVLIQRFMSDFYHEKELAK